MRRRGLLIAVSLLLVTVAVGLFHAVRRHDLQEPARPSPVTSEAGSLPVVMDGTAARTTAAAGDARGADPSGVATRTGAIGLRLTALVGAAGMPSAAVIASHDGREDTYWAGDVIANADGATIDSIHADHVIVHSGPRFDVLWLETGPSELAGAGGQARVGAPVLGGPRGTSPVEGAAAGEVRLGDPSTIAADIPRADLPVDDQQTRLRGGGAADRTGAPETMPANERRLDPR